MLQFRINIWNTILTCCQLKLCVTLWHYRFVILITLWIFDCLSSFFFLIFNFKLQILRFLLRKFLKIWFNFKILSLLHSASSSFDWNSIYYIRLHRWNLWILMKIIALCHIFAESSTWRWQSVNICILFFINLFLLIYYIPSFFRNMNLIMVILSINITNFYRVERCPFDYWWRFFLIF